LREKKNLPGSQKAPGQASITAAGANVPLLLVHDNQLRLAAGCGFAGMAMDVVGNSIVVVSGKTDPELVGADGLNERDRDRGCGPTSVTGSIIIGQSITGSKVRTVFATYS
jgi:hypothetical protein